MSSHSTENLDAALREIEAELSMNPFDCVALYQSAQIQIAQQHNQEAATNLARALELKPAFPEALVALGKLRSAEKKHDEAIALLKKSVELTPGSEAAHYALMMAYRDAGRVADAKHEKLELDKLQKAPEGEFTEFLKKLGEKPALQQ
jgi:tetratricopeptide (TPR) repeat protein